MMIWMWFNHAFSIRLMSDIRQHLIDSTVLSTIARTRAGCIAAYFPRARENDIGKPECFTLSRVS